MAFPDSTSGSMLCEFFCAVRVNIKLEFKEKEVNTKKDFRNSGMPINFKRR